MRWIAVVAICLTVSTHAWAQDWSVRRDPFDVGTVRRYQTILARNPHDADALRKLIALYRRHRTVTKLESEYRAALAKSEDWATLVVLARLPRASRAETIELWKRALTARPDDARGWLALGDMASDATAARDAYRHAAQHAASRRDKRAALTKLVRAAKSANDPRTVDAAFVELIAFAPEDGGLWLERGEAQLAAGRAADAHASFNTAESLLARDPERRLLAMLQQAVALERQGRVDDAIAQYERTLDKVPRRYHLGAEIVTRIVEAQRKRKQLAPAIALFEKRWPERSRGHFEWVTLGDLYKETLDETRALAAYQRAVAKAPTEVGTQRKLIALLDKLRPAAALAQHEAAARIAPGDPDLQLELAKRYQPTDRAKALAVLARLSRRMHANVNVRRAIAELYTRWDEPRLAIAEHEAIASLEPNEPNHAVVLGDAYWEAGDREKARTAWQRLARINTAASLLRLGDVFSLRELWEDAIGAYTQSLALDKTQPDAWRGRAHAYDSLQRFADATSDARRAVALIAHTTRERGHRERHLLARVLGRWHASERSDELPALLKRWRFAFDHGDVAAGYMLAAHHARLGSEQQHNVLVELYKRVPTDDSLGIALARSYSRRKEFARARKELELIAQRSPTRAEEIGELVAQVEQERERAEVEARWDEEGLSREERRRRAAGGLGPDLVGKRSRFGMRLGIGVDVRADEGALLGFGFYRASRLTHGTALVTRFEWTRHDDHMEGVKAFAASYGITRRILDARKFEIAAGLAPRFELRYGYDAQRSTRHRVGLAADATLELLPRALPATFGLRFHQPFTDEVNSSAVMVELGFEVR